MKRGPMKILIAEDNHISRMVVKKFLEGHHYEVFEAKDGYEGQYIWEKERPDLLITDWNMPCLSGVDLVRHVRANEDMYYTYIMITTEREDESDLKEAFDAGVDDFIRKPLNKQELMLRIKAAERLMNLLSKEHLVYALAKLAEMRDDETAGHLERIRLYARTLTSTLYKQGMYLEEINAGFIKNMYETSPLHDIGKVGISDAVLKKEGRFSKEEYDLMKKHTLIGRDTLMSVAQNGFRPYLKMAIEISGSHHEWWDGNGYPEGLKGYEIPLSARIVALADVYDALRSKRIYKAARDHEDVRHQIEKLSGIQFDPLVVEAFRACHERFREISHLYEE